MRGAPRRGLVAAMLAAALFVGWAMPLAAEQPVVAGYWWRYRVGGLPLAPPGVKDGQLHVAADPLGTAAVAAVRAHVGIDEVTALVLSEASSSGTPELAACPTAGWAAPDGAGAFDDRPSEERCADEAVPGVRSTDGRWTFPVGPLVADGVLDVVIIPGVGPQSVTFDAPDATAVVDDSTTSSPAPAPAPTPTPTPTTAPALGSGPAGRPARPGSVAPRPLPLPSADLHRTNTATTAGLATDTPSVLAVAAGPAGVPVTPTGGRAPLALVAVAVVAGTWAYRTRAAVAAAPRHVLAAPLRRPAAGLGEAVVAAHLAVTDSTS